MALTRVGFHLHLRLFVSGFVAYLSNCLIAAAVEYTNCTSAEEYGSTNERPVYDTKQSEIPVMLELCGMWSTASLAFLPVPLTRSGST